ncbi:MAG: glycoside hydrolase family 9 protein, partial [Bacteroidales bacterium]|nr:glycoside hydrolase family 9 protein [Bacteroidales bacterium]
IILFGINQMLIGHNPGENGVLTYDIDKLELQKVNVDQYEGWNVSPGKISFSHIGYRPLDQKIALAGRGVGNTFQISDQSGAIVYSGDVKSVNTMNGVFSQLDFTGLNKSGIYRIHTGDLESETFMIDENIWIQPVFKAINFFFCERCNFNVPGIHSECHKDWQGFKGDERKIINGGWHDAGDLSQGSWRTSMSTLAMMNNLEYMVEKPELSELASRIRDEIAWGLEWLLKSRFGDGYHISFSVMRIYSDNEIGTIDDVLTPAVNIPWENFLAAAVQCKAAMMLEKSHPELATRARVAAIEDWQAAVDSKEKWDHADYKEASWGVSSSLLIAKMTGEEKYSEQALGFGKLLIDCQEQSFLDGIPITGYFYENTERERAIHNYHMAFEEAPIIALSMLCGEFPDHKDWIEWYSAVVLHSEYFLKRGSQIAEPYYHLPNSVWKKSDILALQDSAMRSDMLRQYNDGTQLDKNYTLRTFPVYHNDLFHGSTNIQMSSSWALAEASRLRKDKEGMQLVGKQLEWVFGANPFGQSLMYGVGYDFAPQFAYCLKDIVGSLPVGMDCMNGDRPYWSATNAATSKEIWVEPVNRFLGTAAIYANDVQLNVEQEERLNDAEIKTETSALPDGTINLKVIISGNGKHIVSVKTFNGSLVNDSQEFNLPENSSAETTFSIKVADKDKPYVAVVVVDNDPDSVKEITGSYIDL